MPSLIAIRALHKEYGGDRPLRITALDLAAPDRVALSGLDDGAAETFMHLVTGAVLPESGDVLIDGRSTRDIATDTEWLQSLDRFGIVTDRSVLFEALPVAASMALPLSLSIDPMPPEVRAEVESLASAVGLAAARLDAPASALSALDRTRVHLARAIAHAPRMILLERPTDAFPAAADRRAFGAALRAVSESRGIGWLAVTDDDEFIRAAGGESLRIKTASGTVARGRSWRFPWGRRA